MASPDLAEYVTHASVQACRLRVSRLAAGGAPEVGADNAVVTDALIQIVASPTVSTGDAFEQKNGCGSICVTVTNRDSLTGVDLTMELCELDGELLELMTGASLITVGGVTIGVNDPDENTDPDRVVVEAWTKAWDGTEQATDDAADAMYWHWVWKSTTWVMGQHTLENGILRIPLTGKGIKNSNIGNGPFNDWPADLSGGGAEAKFLDTEIPAAVTGYLAVPAQS